MTLTRFHAAPGVLLLALALAPWTSASAEDRPAPAGAATAQGEAALAKAAKLLAAAVGEDGGVGDANLKLPPNVGFSAMVASALVGANGAGDATAAKALAFVAKHQKDDGSIWSMPQYVTYETSAAISALAIARRPEHRQAQAKARDFLAASQIAAEKDDPSYGGFPYKSKSPQPADLSNLQFAVDALARGELPSDSPVWARVQSYLTRVQNRSETNTTSLDVAVDPSKPDEKKKIVSGDDGGAGYGPGMSKAGYKAREDGTFELVSYGSMTYALLKCLLLSGVDPNDPRVIAALTWLTSRWTLEKNPGFEASKDPAKDSMQGYYYYLYTAARTLSVYERLTKKPLVVKDAEGRTHNWREELIQKLCSLQREDGSWQNAVDRWNEGSPVLVTSYAAQTLATALGRLD